MTPMKAWRQDRYGGPEVVTLVDAPLPQPAQGQLRIRPIAVSVNSADARIMRGTPWLIRLSFGLRRPRTAVQGRDVSGVVDAIGPGVSQFAVGDRVVGELTGGGFAEATLATPDQLVALENGVSHRVAAALPLAGGTAWQALDAARVGAGSRLLILGAGGGVGTLCVRLAVLRGAKVHALCSARAMSAVIAQGPDEVSDRQVDLRTLPAHRYDAIIVLGGNAPFSALRRLLAAPGRIIGISGGEHRVFGPLGSIITGSLSSIGNTRRFSPLIAAANPHITAELLTLAASEALTPVISHDYDFSEVPRALSHMDRGGVVGKTVVRLPAT